ncbi:hypothetical protein J3S90_01655 [Flavobacterium sp. P4023]|uniref:SGNH/GDSL hydrolase family protein n=1 Tax=Flavobacterium flabelliforme TaxID=2816119 RepID=A0ABS5CPF0_9FLAO|nr:hypothetical protein [Flavobacterium flabelliforme]MBP4140503.1 hypothetical protein [Flavobacterium flabelliforme]
MKNFLIYLVKIIGVLFLSLVILDGLYTLVFLQSKNRGKIETVFNSGPEKYDVIILGSSRANNHFVSQMFEDKGLKTFNFGISGSHLFETSLLLKLMIERKYKIKNIILDADLSIANFKQSEGVSAKFLPYIHNSNVIKEHFMSEEDFDALYYIPFYRYIKYENKIGFREVFYTAIHKKTNVLENLGFYSLSKNKKGNMKNDIRALKPIQNKYYDEIKKICAENHINLIAVMTPMCSNTKGLDYFEKVKKIYPEIHNYENAVEGDQYFSSCGHMNDAGARLFTTRILNDFFIKK